MVIKLKQSGGHVRPLGFEISLDGSELPSAERKKLASLLKKANLEEKRGARSKIARDVRMIELSVESEELSFKWKGDETSLPDEATPLIDFVRAHGK